MTSLPDEVDRLLRERIVAVEQLAILLLLRQRQERAWSEDAVASELGMPSALAGEALESLTRAALIDRVIHGRETLFRYTCRADELELAVLALARIHRERPADVLQVLSANALRRMRASAHVFFADALGARKTEKSD